MVKQYAENTENICQKSIKLIRQQDVYRLPIHNVYTFICFQKDGFTPACAVVAPSLAVNDQRDNWCTLKRLKQRFICLRAWSAFICWSSVNKLGAQLQPNSVILRNECQWTTYKRQGLGNLKCKAGRCIKSLEAKRANPFEPPLPSRVVTHNRQSREPDSYTKSGNLASRDCTTDAYQVFLGSSNLKLEAGQVLVCKLFSNTLTFRAWAEPMTQLASQLILLQ